MNVLECPECEGWNTERVHTEDRTEERHEVFICNDCPTQYTVKFAPFEKEVDDV